MFKILDIFRKSKGGSRFSAEKGFLLHKYDHFKNVLTGNNRALEIITELEHLFYEDRPFTLGTLREQTRQLVDVVCEIIEDLNALAGGKYPDLFEALERVGSKILPKLSAKKKIAPTPLVLPLEEIGKAAVLAVGGKAANLGEILNRVRLPVPEGFAVTAYACQYFLEHPGLQPWIDDQLQGLDINDTETLLQAQRHGEAKNLGDPPSPGSGAGDPRSQ